MLTVPIRVLRPVWLDHGGRSRLGIELDCPRHPDGHRVRLWFANPSDGGPPSPLADRLHEVWLDDSDDLEHLSVLTPGAHPYRPIAIGHWLGWLIEGELAEAKEHWR